MSDLIKTLKSSETGNDVYPNIKPDNIPSDAITNAKISDGAVTTDKLASDSVTTAKIHNGAVTTAKIEDESVSTAKIGALAVTTAKIDTGAVTSNKLADSSVTGTKINDGAVSYNKLASALKNLIGDKQDKIDSTHKLDADLVDDSTSTNKFVTATDKTTWSGKQDALVSGTNIKTINNQPLLGSGNLTISGGNQLYRHNIKLGYNLQSPEPVFLISIITDNATPYTTATLENLLELIHNRGFNESNRGFLASGFDNGNIVVSVGVEEDNYTQFYYNYVGFENGDLFYNDSDMSVNVIYYDIVESL